MEYDGQQHFKPVCFGGISLQRAKENLKRQKVIDALDTEFCKERGIILHRIKYDEDKEKSIKRLKEEIKSIQV